MSLIPWRRMMDKLWYYYWLFYGLDYWEIVPRPWDRSDKSDAARILNTGMIR